MNKFRLKWISKRFGLIEALILEIHLKIDPNIDPNIGLQLKGPSLTPTYNAICEQNV